MTELDLVIPELANDLIGEFGKSIEYAERPTNEYDPATSSYTQTGDFITIKGVVEPFTGQRMMAGLVEAEDLKITCPAIAFVNTPTSGDQFRFDGETFNVINVLPTYSGEEVAVYEFQVRRG
jgi:hypothetical protein